MQSHLENFVNAKRVSVPLIAIEAPDPASTIEALDRAWRASEAAPSIIVSFIWDMVKGLTAVGGNTGYFEAFDVSKLDRTIGAAGLVDALELVQDIIVENMDATIYGLGIDALITPKQGDADPGIIQGIWNARDPFKKSGHTLVMIAGTWTLPEMLANDVLIINEAYPDAEALTAIAASVYEADSVEVPDDLSACADAMLGLPAFPAEQAAFMSWDRETETINIDALRQRQMQAINQLDGMTVYRPESGFESIGGNERVKEYIMKLRDGRRVVQVIVWIDEIEKAAGGFAGDSTGVSQDQHEQLLTIMNDWKRFGSKGLMFVGVSGGAKSAVAKASGLECNALVIRLDLGGMKGRYVGESEGRIRRAFNAIYAMSGGNVLFIATSNGIQGLSPELKRRFSDGTFFFDLPTVDERKAIWRIYSDLYEISLIQDMPDDTNWTGAEIETCASKAYDLRISLIEAATYVVPVAQGQPEVIDRLREQANGTFLSTSQPGFYKRQDQLTQTQKRLIR